MTLSVMSEPLALRVELLVDAEELGPGTAGFEGLSFAQVDDTIYMSLGEMGCFPLPAEETDLSELTSIADTPSPEALALEVEPELIAEGVQVRKVLTDHYRISAIDVSGPTEHTCEQRHPDEHPVFDLAEVGSARVTIHFKGNLPNPGQGMHHDHLLFRLGHHLRRNPIVILDLFILGQIGEALFLHAGHIEYIHIFYDFGKIMRLTNIHPCIDDSIHDLQGQPQNLW